MTDEELIADFFKVCRLEEMDMLPSFETFRAIIEPRNSGDIFNRYGLFVCKINWEGPHTPVSEWVKLVEYPDAPASEQVQKDIKRFLKWKTYFKVCDVCGEKNPTGWMGGDTCHSCMEDNGVVF